MRSRTELSQFLSFAYLFCQCRMIVAQGPNAIAVGTGWGCLDSLSLLYFFSCIFPDIVSERAVKPNPQKQPINHRTFSAAASYLFVGQGANCSCSRCEWKFLDIFLSLGDGPI